MNRSRIEYVDYTWNPISGCLHSCEYCYARKFVMRFAGDVRRNLSSPQYSKEGNFYVLEDMFMADDSLGALTYPFGFSPTYHKYAFGYLDKLKRGQNIFVGSMADIFGEWVPDQYINKILNECQKYQQHNYLFLTKYPERYRSIELPSKEIFWYGTTITCKADTKRFNDLPAFNNRFISIEPLLEDIEPAECNILFRQIHWVIIGAETGNRKGKIRPDKKWILDIVQHCDAKQVPVFMKDSLIPIIGEANMRREFPAQLLKKPESEKVLARLESNCVKCQAHLKKSEMIALAARSIRGEMPKQLGHMCHKCFQDWCQEMDIAMPDFAAFKEEK